MTKDEIASDIVKEIAELVEEQKGYDENDSHWDYLAGVIDGRYFVLARLGYGDLLKQLEWTNC